MLVYLVTKTTFKMAAETLIQFRFHVRYMDKYVLFLDFVTGRGKGPGCVDGSIYGGNLRMQLKVEIFQMP